jgi:DNA-binding NarL/FixJ family response regulator
MAMALRERTSIRVIGPDAISRDGLVAQLRARHEVRILESGEDPESSVTIILADEIDEDVLQEIRATRASGTARVVLVANRLDETAVLKAVEAGVGSVLWRSRASIETVVDAVRATSDGEGTIPPDLLGRLLEHMGRLQREVLVPRGMSFSGLTEREIKVLRLVADGLDSAEVGERLYYSERTVKGIIHDVTSRLNLRNRTHAVAYAMRQGLL